METSPEWLGRAVSLGEFVNSRAARRMLGSLGELAGVGGSPVSGTQFNLVKSLFFHNYDLIGLNKIC